MKRCRTLFPRTGSFFLFLLGSVLLASASPTERTLDLTEIGEEPVLLKADHSSSDSFTWWFPDGADEFVLPISAGIAIETSRSDLMHWLEKSSPWSLVELPVFGVRYDAQMLVIIAPWPHEAELIFAEKTGIRYTVPEGRERAKPFEIVAMVRGPDLMEVARGFRQWRAEAEETGAIPRPRSLEEKRQVLEKTNRLLGAPHLYLWGPALFSRHDVPARKWRSFAQALLDTPDNSFGRKMMALFSAKQRKTVSELAESEWTPQYLTEAVARAIDSNLSSPNLLDLEPTLSVAEIIRLNRRVFAENFANFLQPIESWGDGISVSFLNRLHDAGIDRALLVLSDLYGRSLRPDVAARAKEFGYLLGPYDSYHSVHSPDAAPDQTWETAQFDAAAYKQGRIVNADGTGNRGFKGRGFHFSPEAAWPYMEKRIGEIREQIPYTTWFIDCDATGECFDDFHPAHPATKYDDTKLRRQRLSWLETNQKMIVGSEGGSVLFADLIHYGHGVHTPYIGHLEPAFNDPTSPYFLGRYWPPENPDRMFQAIPIPPSLQTPFFDPTVRIPLYQAALGDEIVATHHWIFDSLKFEDPAGARELLEILYLVPPMYHLNRETWPKRKDRILKHFAFFSPLHRKLATVPLTDFEYLSEDRLLQRTTFGAGKQKVTITVNFSKKPTKEYPPHSATVAGFNENENIVYIAQ